MMSRVCVVMGLLVVAGIGKVLAQADVATNAPALSGQASVLYEKARGGKWFGKAAGMQPDIVATSDGKSFLVVWRAVKTPARWIVSLPGTAGFATDDLAIWHPNMKDRPVGFIGVQWWLGTGDAPTAYYTPEQVYREIDLLLQKLKVEPGMVMLHGFSRGSANTFALMALDAGRGRRYFSLAVASSGGVGLDYPPTRAILDGSYGANPLRNTRWITCAGRRDPEPDRDGIPGMRRAAEWLKAQGAIVLESIEDAKEGHGALQRNPENARRALDIFFDDKMVPVKPNAVRSSGERSPASSQGGVEDASRQ